MSWKPAEPPKIPRGYKDALRRDGGIVNAYWQNGGAKLTEFIERDHLYRSKFFAPPTWYEEHPQRRTEIDKKFSKLQKAKEKNFQKSVKRRKMLGKVPNVRELTAGRCSVLSDDEGEEKSSNSSMSSGRLKKLDCNASDSGAGGANLVVERSESDKARLKNSREAAELRQKLTERGKTGTYKFGELPSAEELKKKKMGERAEGAYRGTHEFNDGLTENLSLKDMSKPANALSDRLPPGSTEEHALLSKNWNDPETINREREKKGRQIMEYHKAMSQTEKSRSSGSQKSSGSHHDALGQSLPAKLRLPDESDLLPGSLKSDPWVMEDPKKRAAREENLRRSASIERLRYKDDEWIL